MPLRFEPDHAHQRIVLTGERRITVTEWADCIARQVQEGLWHYATLYDLTGERVVCPGPSELAEITKTALELQQQIGPRGPVAFVLDDDAEYHGIHGWTQSVGARLPYRVAAFRSREDAEHWLEAVPGGRRTT